MRFINNPTELSGCMIWLDSSDAGSITTNATGSISQWSDKSGQANHFVQTDNNKRPIFYASSSIVSFNDQFLQCANSLASIAEGEIFIVFKTERDPATNGGGGFWSISSVPDNSHFTFSDGIIYDDFGTTARKTTGNPTTPLTQFNIYNVVTRTNEWTSRINRMIHFSTNNNTSGFGATPIIGRSTSALYFFVGEIKEVIMFSRGLNPTERTLVERFLNTRHNLYPERSIVVPVAIPDCKLWLDASRGVTVHNSASITAPSDFSNAVWTKVNVTVGTGISDPFGGLEADRIVDTSAGLTNYLVYQTVPEIALGPKAQFSIYLKSDGISWVLITGNSGGVGVWFDINTGVKGTESNATGIITSVGSGWYLCHIEWTPTTTRVDIYLAPSDGASSYSGTGTGAIQAYGASLSQMYASQWNDQSGNNHHAFMPNTINGVPYVTASHGETPSLFFDGTNTWLSGTMSLSQDKTLFVVCKDAGSTDGISGIVVAHQNDGGTTAQGFYYDAANDLAVSDFAGGSANISTSHTMQANQKLLLMNCYKHDGIKSKFNGGETQFRSGADRRQSTTVYHVGFRNDGISTRRFKGHIYEVIWYNRVLSDAEIALVERYLNRKH